jgi:hypothetical protein
MNSSRVARNLRVRIGRFSGDLSNGLSKPAGRFVGEMVYGILASESVMLTDVSRRLEENIELRKTHGRLSRNLQRPELERCVGDNLLGMAAGRIDDDSLLIIDPSDISKTHAKKMEFIGMVRDGSTKQIAPGYWTLHIVGAKVGSSNIVPLHQRLWSSKAPGFESENAEILNAVDSVMKHVGHRGLWVMDRGGDRIKLFAPMLERGARFLFRLRGDRHVVYRGKNRLAISVALNCPCNHTKHITRIIDGEEKALALSFGVRKVRLPKRPEQLFMVVIRGFGKKPLMLLTSEEVNGSYKRLWPIIKAYLKRWAVEDTIRHIKTCYDLENVRILKYQGLQNLMPLVLAAVYFASCVLDQDARLRVMAGFVEKAAKRLFGIPDFKLYALADGLTSIFARHPGRPTPPKRPPKAKQMTLNLQLMT